MFRISHLEALTGVPRRTIYHYVSQGLLPPAQKAHGGAALYSESHVVRLNQIRSLRRQRVSLKDIREHFASIQGAGLANDADLAAKLEQDIRERILQTAARAFSLRGYRKTRMVDIISELGIAPGTLYRSFPTKRQLFLEVINLLAAWMVEHVEGQVAEEQDPVKRNLLRVSGFLGLRRLSPDLLTIVRAEALSEDADVRNLVRHMYQQLLATITEDFESVAQSGKSPLFLDPELTSYALLGAIEAIVMRMSWDNRYDKRDYFWMMVGLYVAADVIFRDGLGLREQCARYSDVVEELLRKGEPSPRQAVSLESGAPDLESMRGNGANPRTAGTSATVTVA